MQFATARRIEVPAASPPDDALVRAAMADPAAFGDLYGRYMPPVYRYLRTRCGTSEDAADLTQLVFTRAFEALPSFRPGSSPFPAWLFRIARNAAVDAHRRRRPNLALDGLPEALQGIDRSTPETAALANERLRALRDAIASLDGERRDLLALRYAGGLSSAEIAPLVGKSEAAVKKQLFRTVQKLKEHFRDDISLR